MNDELQKKARKYHIPASIAAYEGEYMTVNPANYGAADDPATDWSQETPENLLTLSAILRDANKQTIEADAYDAAAFDVLTRNEWYVFQEMHLRIKRAMKYREYLSTQ